MLDKFAIYIPSANMLASGDVEPKGAFAGFGQASVEGSHPAGVAWAMLA